MSTRNAPEAAPDRFLERDGARLRWRLEGSGPAVALLHGWALDLDAWNPVAARLAPAFTVVRFDRCGFGQSTGRPDIHRNVADLGAVLAAAGLERTVLVAMSQGARLAIHFALEHASRVRGLLLDGAPALEAEPELPLAEYRRLLETQGERALQAQVLQHPLMRLETPATAAHELLRDVVAHYRGLDLLHPAVRGRPPDLRRIGAPTLILNGACDSPARLAAGATLQAAIPGSRSVRLAGAGHLALLDDARAYADVVADFCGTLPP